MIVGCSCFALLFLLAVLMVGGWYLAKDKIAALITPTPSVTTEETPSPTPTEDEPTIKSDSRFVTATMCRSLKPDQQPDEISSTFSPGDKFYCSVEVTGVSKGDTVTAKWYRENNLIKEYPFTIESPEINFIGFSLSLPNPWPVDDKYRIEIYMGSTLVNVLPFSVAAAEGTETTGKTVDETWKKYLESAEMCESLDESSQTAVNPISTYGSRDTFYVSVRVKDLPPDSRVTTKWYYGTQFIDAADVPTPTGWTGYIGFHCKPSKTWPAGDYSVEIYFNDKLAGMREFQVE